MQSCCCSLHRDGTDGWMDDFCDFTSFSTGFQSYQDDEWMIKKDLCSGTLFTVKKISTSGLLDQ